MTDHEPDLFLPEDQVPLGFEPLAECGIDRAESIRLCRAQRAAGIRSYITIRAGGWHTVYAISIHHWPTGRAGLPRA